MVDSVWWLIRLGVFSWLKSFMELLGRFPWVSLPQVPHWWEEGDKEDGNCGICMCFLRLSWKGRLCVLSSEEARVNSSFWIVRYAVFVIRDDDLDYLLQVHFTFRPWRANVLRFNGYWVGAVKGLCLTRGCFTNPRLRISQLQGRFGLYKFILKDL